MGPRNLVTSTLGEEGLLTICPEACDQEEPWAWSQQTWVLVLLLLLTSALTLNKIGNLSKTQFCHLSPT